MRFHPRIFLRKLEARIILCGESNPFCRIYDKVVCGRDWMDRYGTTTVIGEMICDFKHCFFLTQVRLNRDIERVVPLLREGNQMCSRTHSAWTGRRCLFQLRAFR